ncbi:MAG: phage tail protein [Gemmatimonas sp.]
MAVIGALGLGIRGDPPMAYNFTINLIDTSSTMALLKSAATSALSDVVIGGFTECTGLEMSLDVEEYKEGGNNGALLKFPTRVSWSPIVLKAGMGAGSGLWDWHYGFVTGKGKRLDGIITLMNDLHLPTRIWHFKRGLPKKYSGPSLNASANAVAIESIEIVHEGLYQLPNVGYAAAATSFGISAAVR